VTCPTWTDEAGAEIVLGPREANLVRTVLALAVKGRRLRAFSIVLKVHGASVAFDWIESGSLAGQTTSSGGAYNIDGGAA